MSKQTSLISSLNGNSISLLWQIITEPIDPILVGGQKKKSQNLQLLSMERKNCSKPSSSCGNNGVTMHGQQIFSTITLKFFSYKHQHVNLIIEEVTGYINQERSIRSQTRNSNRPNLKFLHTGTFEYFSMDRDLFEVADKYQVETLMELCRLATEAVEIAEDIVKEFNLN